MNSTYQSRLTSMTNLLAQIKLHLPALETWVADNGIDENFVYRFYHQSFKVFYAQDAANEGLELIKKIGASEGLSLTEWHLQIMKEGSTPFQNSVNEAWLENARPVLEAYWHTRYFILMMIKSAKELTELTTWSPD